jgi:hypothetical protein
MDFAIVTVPIMAGAAALISAVAALGRGRIQIGQFKVDFDRGANEALRQRLNTTQVEREQPQYALLREYHAQGLAQSRVSFWFSLVFASIGFSLIALSIVLFLQEELGSSTEWLKIAAKPVFTLVSGTVIDAVAALFFVQSNKSRQLMVEFFDKLRLDRKLDEALKLAAAIEDPLVGSNLKALLALNFADVKAELPIFESVISGRVTASAPRPDEC